MALRRQAIRVCGVAQRFNGSATINDLPATTWVLPTPPIRQGLTLSHYNDDPDSDGTEFQIDALTVETCARVRPGQGWRAPPTQAGGPTTPEQDAARVCALSWQAP